MLIKNIGFLLSLIAFSNQSVIYYNYQNVDIFTIITKHWFLFIFNTVLFVVGYNLTMRDKK